MGERGVEPVVIFGPSGAGKSTLVKRLMSEFPGVFGLSVSHTTRGPRAGEEHGREYYFVSRPDMLKSIRENRFVEHAEFGGNFYGTSRSAIETIARSGRVCILDLEIRGCESMRGLAGMAPLFVFIRPPSLAVLEQRLRARGTETEGSLQRRMEAAGDALRYGATPGNFDVVVVNDDLEHAYRAFRGALLPQVGEVRHLQQQQP